MITTFIVSGAILGGLAYFGYVIKKAPLIDDPDNVLSNADISINSLSREEKKSIHNMRMPVYDNTPKGKDLKKIKKGKVDPELIKNFPQVTFQVKDIEAEIKKYKLKVITPPSFSTGHSITAVVELNGEPVELVEFTKQRSDQVD